MWMLMDLDGYKRVGNMDHKAHSQAMFLLEFYATLDRPTFDMLNVIRTQNFSSNIYCDYEGQK